MNYEPFVDQAEDEPAATPARPRRRGRPPVDPFLRSLRDHPATTRKRSTSAINAEVLDARREDLAALRRAILDRHRADRRTEVRDYRRQWIGQRLAEAPETARLSVSSVAKWIVRRHHLAWSMRTLRADIAAIRKAGNGSSDEK